MQVLSSAKSFNILRYYSCLPIDIADVYGIMNVSQDKSKGIV